MSCAGLSPQGSPDRAAQLASGLPVLSSHCGVSGQSHPVRSPGPADQTKSIRRQLTCRGHEPTAQVSRATGDSRVCVTITWALVKRDIPGSNCQSFRFRRARAHPENLHLRKFSDDTFGPEVHIEDH